MTMPDVEDIFRLSYAQQGLVYHSLATPTSGFYVDQIVYTLDGPLDIETFEATWQWAVERHPALRTSFHSHDLDELVQVVHVDVDLRVRVLDWSAGTEPADRGLDRFLDEDRNQEFDLESPPLIRVTLLRTAESQHVFVFRYHHALLDAWSALMLLDEVFTRYAERTAGAPAPAVPTRPYRDYVAWLHSRDLDAAKRYWHTMMRGFTTPTPLPGARVRTAAPPTGPASASPESRTTITEPVANALRELAKGSRITLNSVFEALWAVLLLRYADTDDVVFGTTVTNRPLELDGVQETLGLFINTVPARVRATASDTFAECCAAIHADRTARRAYEYSPLADVQQCVELPTGVPLFETIMTFLNVPGIENLDGRPTSVGAGLMVRSGRYRYRTNYPLSVMVIPGAEIAVRIGYDESRLDRAAVDRMAMRLRGIAEVVAREPDLAIGDIPLTSDTTERQDTADRTRDADTESATHTDLLALIRAVADRAPDAIALAHHSDRITYRDMVDRANRIAAHLIALGVRPGDRCGLCLKRGPDLVTALLGIMAAGAAYVPLDPSYPDDRLRYMLADASVSVLVTERELRDRLPRGDRRTVLIDAHHRTISRQSAESPAVPLRPDSLAYVIYTSGSTGAPKGTMIGHAGLLNLVTAQRSRFGTTSRDRVLQWASASFDASIFEIVLALGAGATLVTADQDEVAPHRLPELLAAAGITLLVIPPSALSAVPASELPELRTVVVAGEALPADLVTRWAAGRTVVNAYGPTEASVWVTAHDCEPGAADPPIGSPIPGARTRVLSSRLRPVSTDIAGELWVAGAGLARGYLGRPGQTATRFVADPFGPAGTRMYRTGDVVRRRPGGALEYLRRADTQIKLRGFRIETGEIESVLRRHPAVRDGAVVVDSAVPDAPGAGRLVAYVVASGPDVPSDTELRSALSERLPGFMVPEIYHFVERIPLTPNGKRDLSALPSLDSEIGDDSGEYVAPRSASEELLAEIWSGVLGVARIGVTDDFFRLGGNSIKGTLLASRVKKACDVELPLRALMELRTIENCAARLEELVTRQLAVGVTSVEEQAGDSPCC